MPDKAGEPNRYAVWRCTWRCAGSQLAHVNSIAYDAKDDHHPSSAIRYCKIGRDKQKWILAPSKGWNKQLASKLLKPVDDHGKSLTRDENGKCKDTGISISPIPNIRHAGFPSKGTLTVLITMVVRPEQPASPDQQIFPFCREYKIDEEERQPYNKFGNTVKNVGA